MLLFIRHPKPQLKRCHSEPQLKECHVFIPYPKPQFKGYVLSHNLRNPLASRSLRYHPKSCRPCILNDHKHFASTLSPGVALKPPREIQFQTVWRKPQPVRRQMPQTILPLQVSPSGTHLTARHHMF
ncbi:hypothetical protein DEO72_LG10g2399 [Vigna unguiculata]|uniref:Uncharacterized protein n=1 Tax=Vigna unguiculata TaxID=3917 RepID=A0A4D6NBT7_VIGUN|nr:hypothetical protein DEO72_LG10g2399 [Vigna unguiculata]